MNKKINIHHKRISIVFPKDSESVFNNSTVTFGGATVQLYNFARELSKNHAVYTLINEYDGVDPSDHKDFNIVFTYNKKDNVFKKIFKFHKVLQKTCPEAIIQRGLSLFSSFLAIYCFFYGIKFIFMYAHDRESRGRYQKSNRKNIFYPLLMRFAYALIVQSDFQKNHIPQKYSHKINKIKNGYAIKSIDFSKKKGILWVSRLEPWKRPEKFLALAKRLPDISFIMIAPVVKNHEKYAEKIYSMVDEIPNITLYNFVNFKDIDIYFNQAKLFVNTSEEEGFPNTFVQSCKNYTPILSLKVNPDNCISRYQIGFCCEDNEENMYDSAKLILRDDELYEIFAQSAYNYAKENHSIEENVKMLQCLI